MTHATVTAIYDRYSYDREQRLALDTWGPNTRPNHCCQGRPQGPLCGDVEGALDTPSCVVGEAGLNASNSSTEAVGVHFGHDDTGGRGI